MLFFSTLLHEIKYFREYHKIIDVLNNSLELEADIFGFNSLIATRYAPSTGKTTLSNKLSKIFKTKWMPEYGRSYWEKNNTNRRLTKSQLVEIAEKHLIEENKLIKQSRKYLFTDTNAVTTYMFGKYYHGEVLPELEHLASSSEKRYDLWFLCGDDIPYEDTWDRSGIINRKWFQYQIESDLKVRKIPYIKLLGDLNQRIEQVKLILSKHEKFESILNTFVKG